jgi:hypothetical protein
MITAQWNGRCFICGTETLKNVDRHDPATRRNYHQGCYLNVIHIEEPAREEAERLATRLGYSKSASPA